MSSYTIKKCVQKRVKARVRKVSCRNTIDLDHVLDLDDNLFNFFHFNRYLDSSDIPNQIVLEGFNCSITKLNLHDGEATISSRRFLLNSGTFLLNPFQNRQSVLLLTNDTATTITELSRAFGSFDSHRRNRRGLTGSDGSLLLLMFSRLEHVQNYIELIHLGYQGRERQ